MKVSAKKNEPSDSNHDWDLLFDELCRAHRLKWRQKWLLKNLSQTLDVEPAARLFVEPKWFAIAAHTQGLRHRKRQLVELYKILFRRDKNEPEKIEVSTCQTLPDQQSVGV